ncbi:MAG: hypothetical protein ABW252_16255 [Polyangiales bacterium]
MSFPRLLFTSALALAALATTGCDNATSLGPLVPFSRPEHIAFACFASRVDAPAEFDVLPQLCCSRNVGRDDVVSQCGLRLTPSVINPAEEVLVPGTYNQARLHALITQSTRGEVAAVDMTVDQDERVLDSDSLIPGYTFLDSGGLPSAVVMPPKQPRATGTPTGAKYVFVTSAEEHQLRAIPACRFRSGRACGPELDAATAGQMLAPRLILPLPSAPGDMLLGPDDALWITLPELSLIARVELADPAVSSFDAFAIDPATRAPKVPQFFRVPDAPAVEPPAPVAEAEAYAEVCGLGVPYRPAESALPLSPRAPAAPVRPTLLRFDARSGMLLVADASAPVVHAFAVGTAGTLTFRGALPTGAPIRDLALTAPVPATVARTDTGAPAPLAQAQADALPSVRYLYAIDDRDGSVMVFRYDAEGGTARLTPLLAPVPNARFADRLDIANLSSPAAALEIVDTRFLDTLACDPAASSSDPIKAASGPSNLRGVFVAVATEAGTIANLDVYDMDLACRAEEDCTYAGDPQGLVPKRRELRAAVAVRRHAARRSAAASLGSAPGNIGLFSDLASCEPYTAVTSVEGRPRVCAPTDPWLMISDSWSVQYQPSLPGASGTSGVLTDVAEAPVVLGPDELLLKAPTGLDLCGRGVLPGDRVAVAETETSARAQNDPCGSVGGTDESELLVVRQAYRDKLVVATTAANPAEMKAQLTRCYPDFVRFDVRAGSFLVLGSNYLNNVIADPQGVCVPDPARPLQTSRAEPGKPFRSPYLSFQLDPTTAADADALRTSSLPITAGSTALTSSLVTGNFSDVLPSELRFNAGTKELYVVDSASQGLTRYTFNPFVREN